MAAMARLNLSDPVHSSYFNHWLIWKFGERFKVGFVWEFVAGERHTWEMRIAWPGNPGILEAYLDRYGVLTLILHTAELPVVEHLRRLGWVVVHVDNSHTILVRQAPEGAPVYRLLRPWPELTITPANARPVLQESEHALQACPQPSTEASFAHAAKINALMALGRLAEAREAEAAVPLELIER